MENLLFLGVPILKHFRVCGIFDMIYIVCGPCFMPFYVMICSNCSLFHYMSNLCYDLYSDAMICIICQISVIAVLSRHYMSDLCYDLHSDPCIIC